MLHFQVAVFHLGYKNYQLAPHKLNVPIAHNVHTWNTYLDQLQLWMPLMKALALSYWLDSKSTDIHNFEFWVAFL